MYLCLLDGFLEMALGCPQKKAAHCLLRQASPVADLLLHAVILYRPNWKSSSALFVETGSIVKLARPVCILFSDAPP